MSAERIASCSVLELVNESFAWDRTVFDVIMQGSIKSSLQCRRRLSSRVIIRPWKKRNNVTRRVEKLTSDCLTNVHRFLRITRRKDYHVMCMKIALRKDNDAVMEFDTVLSKLFRFEECWILWLQCLKLLN